MSAEPSGSLPDCENCPYKKSASLLQTATLVFALAMWGVDNVIAWVTRFLPAVENYDSAWWMNIVIVGMLAASHLWTAPKIWRSGNGSGEK